MSRVIGGTRSDIDGMIKTTGFSGVNLFLINPKGVVFGSNASLDVEGSFHVTTADSIRLGKTNSFDAMTSGDEATLITTVPEAFGFLGDKQPAGIIFEGSNINVPDGNLSIIGGDITIADSSILKTQGGQFNLASVASVGEVILGIDTIETNDFLRMGKITKTGNPLKISYPAARIQVSGPIEVRVVIRSGQFVMENASIQNVHFDASTDGDPSNTAIDIRSTDRLLMKTGTEILVSGSGRDLSFETKNLELENGARISMMNTNPTQTSQVKVEARDVVVEGVIKFPGPALSSQIVTTGGDIMINTERLRAAGGGNLETKKGNIAITASEIILDGVGRGLRSGLLATTPLEGDTGDVTVNTDRLEIKQGARITTSAITSSFGNSGELLITANNILLDGFDGNHKSSIQAEAQGQSEGSGKGGDLTINKKDLLLRPPLLSISRPVSSLKKIGK